MVYQDDQISVYFGSLRSEKSPRFVLFGANLTHFRAKSDMPVSVSVDMIIVSLNDRIDR